MAKAKLTAGYANGLAAADGEFHWDTELKGFGLRVRPGSRTWFVKYRTKSGLQRKHKLGSLPAVTADEARRKAKSVLGSVADGGDPQGDLAALRAAATVRELAADYMERHARVSKGQADADGDQGRINNRILPKLGSKKAADVTRRDIEDIHRAMQTTPYAANRVLSLLSKMFALGITWGLRPDNPAKGSERFAEHKREGWMSDEEIKTMFGVMEGMDNPRASNAVKLLLLTGARMREVLHSTWDQFDLPAGTWTKPAHFTKQKKLHHVRLSAPAMTIVAGLRAAAEAKAAKAAEEDGSEPVVSPFLFPGDVAGQPLDSIKRFWRAVMEEAKLGTWEAPKGDPEGEPVFRPKYRVHDLRHTFVSHLVASGESLLVVGQLVGHTQLSTTQRYAHLAPNAGQAATDRFAAKLEALATGKPAGEVLEFHKGSAMVA
jgi:integrase